MAELQTEEPTTGPQHAVRLRESLQHTGVGQTGPQHAVRLRESLQHTGVGQTGPQHAVRLRESLQHTGVGQTGPQHAVRLRESLQHTRVGQTGPQHAVRLRESLQHTGVGRTTQSKQQTSPASWHRWHQRIAAPRKQAGMVNTIRTGSARKQTRSINTLNGIQSCFWNVKIQEVVLAGREPKRNGGNFSDHVCLSVY